MAKNKNKNVKNQTEFSEEVAAVNNKRQSVQKNNANRGACDYAEQ
ncbi:hypothetical protein O9H85_29865 [Paenibacillus filicis]|uniref:Glycogen biosynthesis protein GlgD n=1 Tax=Paenibacillus gyeongsangnamensis TaxID=3388067 RepID=A0ABT4QI15_9BACL|nr:hypothetical protein [Paenibacillus filicis]MCZ8516522.1 hypothetical protein [Paenibacillus filicis]